LFQIELWKPDCCENDVWELLEECWNREEQMRPNFAQIDLFLKRKTLTAAAYDVQV
jgi:hypothetical protein